MPLPPYTVTGSGPPPGMRFDHATGQWVPWANAPGTGIGTSTPIGTGGVTLPIISTGMGTELPGTGRGSDLPGTRPTFPGTGAPPIFQPTLPNPAGPTPGTGTGTDTPPTDTGGYDWMDLLKKILGVQPGSQQGAALPAIAALVRILGGLSKGRAEGRVSEANQARLYDYLNLARTRSFYDRAGTELDQRKFAQDLQERSYKNATRAQLLQNFSGPTITPPDAIAPFAGRVGNDLDSIPQAQRDEIGGSMYRNAITELLDPLQPGTATSGRRMAALPEPDPISPTPEAGTLDDILNWSSIIGGGLFGPQQATTPTPGSTQTPTIPDPPPQEPVHRSPDTAPQSTPPRPDYVGDVTIPRSSLGDLMSPSSASPLSSSSPVNMARSAPPPVASRLPSIASMVPEVPGVTSPLSAYDPYGLRRVGRV